MPNWCANSLNLAHENPEMITRAVKAASEGRLLSEFVPCPQALLDTEGGWFGDERQKEIDAKRESNIAEYGYANWYDWRIANWGCKWDVDCHADAREDANNASFAFDSAWSPPIEFYEQLEEQGFVVEAYWYEPGMCFCGMREDGANDDYEIQGDSDWVVKHIPRAIDERMGISESMAQWENDTELWGENDKLTEDE